MTGNYPSNLVELTNICFCQQHRTIFNNININIERHKITAILGASGAGKTTLLRLISRQVTPVSGQISFDDVNLLTLSAKQIYAIRRQMGMLFQNPALFTDLDVFDNVAFPLREHTDLSEEMIRCMVLLKLQSVGLRGVHHLLINQLSGGMQRRVALTRAIALDPKLIMYDEPFTGQDPITKGIILKLIRNLNDNLRMTTVLVSHDVKETLQIADYVYLIANQQIISHGTPQQIIDSQQPQVQQFINGQPDGPAAFHHPAEDYWQDLVK